MSVTRYANLLFEMTQSTDTLEELRAITYAIREDKVILKYFLSRSNRAGKIQIIKNVMRNLNITEYVMHFIILVIKYNRLRSLHLILDEYSKMLDRFYNIKAASVTSATELTKDEKVTIESLLEKKLMTKIRMSYEIDRKILGGIVLSFDNSVIDLSFAKLINNIATAI